MQPIWREHTNKSPKDVGNHSYNTTTGELILSHVDQHIGPVLTCPTTVNLPSTGIDIVRDNAYIPVTTFKLKSFAFKLKNFNKPGMFECEVLSRRNDQKQRLLSFFFEKYYLCCVFV